MDLMTYLLCKREGGGSTKHADTADYATVAGTTDKVNGKQILVDDKIPAEFLPSYVDDIEEYDGVSSFPNPGESGKIYVDSSTNKVYRWSGSQYIEISADENNKVQQTATDTERSPYEILFSGTADNTTRTEGVRKSSKLTFNPGSGTLEMGNTSITDGSINFDGDDFWGNYSTGGLEQYGDGGHFTTSVLSGDTVGIELFDETGGVSALKQININGDDIVLSGNASGQTWDGTNTSLKSAIAAAAASGSMPESYDQLTDFLENKDIVFSQDEKSFSLDTVNLILTGYADIAIDRDGGVNTWGDTGNSGLVGAVKDMCTRIAAIESGGGGGSLPDCYEDLTSRLENGDITFGINESTDHPALTLTGYTDLVVDREGSNTWGDTGNSGLFDAINNICNRLPSINDGSLIYDDTQVIHTSHSNLTMTGYSDIILDTEYNSIYLNNRTWGDTEDSDLFDAIANMCNRIVDLEEGGNSILSGTTPPTSSLGNNNDLYIEYVDDSQTTTDTLLTDLIQATDLEQGVTSNLDSKNIYDYDTVTSVLRYNGSEEYSISFNVSELSTSTIKYNPINEYDNYGIRVANDGTSIYHKVEPNGVAPMYEYTFISIEGSKTITNKYVKKLYSKINGTWLEATSQSYIEVTQAQYDALPASKLTDGVMYCITDSKTGITDVKVNGTSVVDNNGVANITVADEKVKQTNSSDNQDYRILLSGTANDTEATTVSYKNAGLTYNPSLRSFTQGVDCVATTSCAHAEGYETTANEEASHAEGGNTYVDAPYGHAEGENTHVYGDRGHAEGDSTTALGYNSHAEGLHTIASHRSQHVFGMFNIEDPKAPGPSNRGNYIEIVGNGDSTTALSNARTLDWDGNEVLAGKLTVGAQPTNDNDVATKKYVDDHGGSGGGVSDVEVNGISVVINNIAEIPAIVEYDSTKHALTAGTRASGSLTGEYSVAEGESVTASGKWSHAEGKNTKAIDIEAHAEGYGTCASGQTSHAEGQNTRAIGVQSHAEGSATFAIGNYGTHAEGAGTTALGDFSHTEGGYTAATYDCCHAEGYHTTSSGNSAHAEGYYTVASGEGSHAEGGYSTYTGADITTANTGTYATTTNAHAEGLATLASGKSSHAEGYQTLAKGFSAHAEGNCTTANGFDSHAEGHKTYAEKTCHSEGYETTAIGDASHAQGLFTIAKHRAQHVFGEYNVPDPSTASTTSIGKYIEIVGNGFAKNDPSNARTLDWDGNEVLSGALTTTDVALPSGSTWDGTNTNLKAAIANLQIQIGLLQELCPDGVAIEDNITLKVGDTVTIKSLIVPADSIMNIMWSIDDQSVASVNDGVVTGLSAGTATITARKATGGQHATSTCVVTVTE